MKKLIEKVFGVKILSADLYDDLTHKVAECGKVYRAHSGDSYHHYDATVLVKLTDLSKICLVENLIWDGS